jgi:hypothetical protein
VSELFCALCWYTRADAEDAVMVIDGYSVCDDHAGYFQGGQLSRAIAVVKKEDTQDS